VRDITAYEAVDGARFNDRQKCIAYEDKLAQEVLDSGITVGEFISILEATNPTHATQYRKMCLDCYIQSNCQP